MKVRRRFPSFSEFLTLGPYEKDEGYRELLASIARQGMLAYGSLGAILVILYVAGNILIIPKSVVWTYSGIDPSKQIMLVDKGIILFLSLVVIVLSRTKLSLDWLRVLISVMVWVICLAMLLDDLVAGGDISFSTGYISIALIMAVGAIPYTGWQTALLNLFIIATTAFLFWGPAPSFISEVDPSRTQIINLSLVALVLTGMSSLIYFNRYQQYKARSRAEQLSLELEERARVLERMKEKSERQAEKILEHEKLKDRFFANISHEFRTPLTLILGPLKDILAETEGKDKRPVRVEVLRLIEKSGLRLLQMINQLLDLSKIDAGKIDLNPQTANIADLVCETVLSFAPLAESRKIDLSCEIEKNPLLSKVDALQMERVLSNLLSNALKFTPEEGRVRVSVLENENPVRRISIRVTDSGTGIPDAELPHIFDRFYQARHTGNRFSEGTGIGLALVKEIVELHDGNIRVESKPGSGTEFTIDLYELSEMMAADYSTPEQKGSDLSRGTYLPVEREISKVPAEDYDLPEEDAVESVPENAPTVLLVDDNQDILDYLQPYLSQRYHVTALAESGKVLEQVRENQVDLVISDVMMPEPDGLELCRLIKGDSKLSHIPVILLTARAGEEYRLEGLELGADDYISKPFSASELLVRVENLIEIRRLLRNKYSQEVRIEGKEVEVNSADARFLKRIQSVIDELMENSNFGVDWLADEVNLSPRQLQRKIRSATDLSAGGYIRLMRLERASQLLSQEWGNVSEVSYKVGFQDARYFSRLFKQTFGVTPTEFVKNKN